MRVETRGVARIFVVLLAASIAIGPSVIAPLGASATLPPASTERLYGADRYATAVAVSQDSHPDGAETAVLVTGEDYPDALIAAPVAHSLGAPLLLTTRTSLLPAVEAELLRLGVSRVVIVGGPAVVGPAVADRLGLLDIAVERHAGGDRYETAERAVVAHFETSSTVYLATGRDFPDSLAASAAAARIGAPLLITDGARSSADDRLLLQLQALDVTTVRIAGGASVVTDGLERDLGARGYAVERLGGADRYETARAVARSVGEPLRRVILATGVDYPDALSAAAFSARADGALLLSTTNCMSDPVHQALSDSAERIELTIVGGEGALSPAVAAATSCASVRAQQRLDLERRLSSAISAAANRAPGTYSVSVRQLDGLLASVDVRGDVMQEPASVMKLFAVYGALKRIEQGRLYYSSRTASGVTVADCMRVSIHISDNSCHWDLVELIGPQALNDLFAAEGFRATVYAGRRWNGESYSSKHTTTADVAQLLARLEQGTLLAESHTRYFVTLLETQLWRSRLPAATPPGVPVGNKVGQLWRSTGMIEADAAIVVSPRSTYTIAVIGSGGATEAGVRDIGRAVAQHLLGTTGPYASYSDLNLRTNVRAPYYRYLSDLRAGRAPLGWLPAGTRVEADQSHRLVYQVIYGGRSVFIDSRHLSNAIAYPRSQR